MYSFYWKSGRNSVFFFFSSRRRHTRSLCDWSSDVCSSDLGGDEMDEAIISHTKREYKLLIGNQTAEEIKLEIGSAFRMKDEVQAEVRGRDMLTGLPKTVIMSSDEV